MLRRCSGPPGRPPYLSGARCFFSQLRSSSAGLVSALGLVPCRSESPRKKQPGEPSAPVPAGLPALPGFPELLGEAALAASRRLCGEASQSQD